jgi:recombination associated protein RdgC
MFRNLHLYRLPAGISPPPEELAQQLAKGAFQPCGANDTQSMGWVELHDGAGLVYSQNQQRLLCLQTEEKSIPGSYVARLLKTKADEWEEKQGYRPGRKTQREIKEQIVAELIPRAFPRISRTLAWIDNLNGWLVIDASSEARCDDVISHLHRSLDMLPQIARPRLQHDTVFCMTQWLAAGQGPAGFTIDRECELKDRSDEKGVVRYSRVNIDTDEVRLQINQGKVTTRMALTWNDRISFVLTDGFAIKRIQILDILKEDLERVANAADLFDANFALETGELAKVISDLVAACGGETPGIDAQN